MAQGSLTRIVSEAMRSGARCTRALHESAAAKKPLHNTESVVGLVADSMGRSRVKLTASDVERNGLSRVGPTTDVLHQASGCLTRGLNGRSPMATLSNRFHTSAWMGAEEECDRPAKGQLPCQRTFNIPGVRKKEKYQGKGSCEKLCMPCCEPARDPPECLSIYQKPPCTKFKNPRPSFSECRKKFPFRHTMCECEVPAKPRCDQKKKNSESTC